MLCVFCSYSLCIHFDPHFRAYGCFFFASATHRARDAHVVNKNIHAYAYDTFYAVITQNKRLAIFVSETFYFSRINPFNRYHSNCQLIFTDEIDCVILT